MDHRNKNTRSLHFLGNSTGKIDLQNFCVPDHLLINFLYTEMTRFSIRISEGVSGLVDSSNLGILRKQIEERTP